MLLYDPPGMQLLLLSIREAVLSLWDGQWPDKPISQIQQRFRQISYNGAICSRTMVTPSSENIFNVTGPLCEELTYRQWRGAFMVSFICVWINGWVNRREAGDLRRYHAHYDVIVMIYVTYCHILIQFYCYIMCAQYCINMRTVVVFIWIID